MTLPGNSVKKINNTNATVALGSRIPVVIGPGDGTGFIPGNVYLISQLSAVYGSENGGYGPGPDQVAENIQQSGGTVAYVPVTASIAAPTITVTSSSLATMSVTGTPNDDYQFVMTVLSGGAMPKVQYSLDGGLNNADPVIASGSNSIPLTGMSFTLDGSPATNDTFSFNAVPKTMNAADLTAGVDTLLANVRYIGGTPGQITIADWPLTATSGSAMFSAIDSAQTTLENKDVRTQFIMHAGPRPTGTSTAQKAADGATNTAAMSTVSSATGNIQVACQGGGNQRVYSGIAGCITPMRPHRYSFSGRAASVDVSTNPAWKKLGNLPEYVVQNTLTIASPYYDEYADGELYTSDINRMEAPRTYLNQAGVYPTNDMTHCAANSSYKSLHRGKVANLAADVVQQLQDQFVNDEVNCNSDGTIASVDATIIEGIVGTGIKANLVNVTNNDNGKKGYVSSYNYSVNRTNDVLGTSTLQSTLTIVPKADVKNLQSTISFTSTNGATVVSKT